MDNVLKNLVMNPEMASIYSNVDGLSLQNLFFVKNNSFPNCYMFSRGDRGDGEKYFDTNEIAKYFETELSKQHKIQAIRYVTENISSQEIRTCFLFYIEDINIYGRIENNISESYLLYDNNNGDSLIEIKNILMKFVTVPEEEKNNIYKILLDNTGYHLVKSKIKEYTDFSIERDYNDDFVKEDEKIKKFIETKDKAGIVILHGEKGTGKTTYIRNLVSTHPENRFIFVGSDLVGQLGNPAFTGFLNQFDNHIVIIEDCENAIRDRKTNSYSASAVSTLLNLSDGLLADDLSIKFICTFNADIKDIDPALLRKGRLISKYEFKPLNVEKCNKLLEYLYENDKLNLEEGAEKPVSTKALSLADIYNFGDDSYANDRKMISFT